MADRPGRKPDLILAIDTSLGAVSTCVMRSGSIQAEAVESEVMARGHADALVPMIGRVMAAVEDGFPSLARVAVATGPGSFTGIRVGLAAARAIGLARKVPVVGVSTLAALAAPVIAAGTLGGIAVAIDAHHGHVFVQGFAADGAITLPPSVMSAAAAVRAVGPGPVRLVGSGAPMMAIEAWSAGILAEIDERASLPDILFVARLGWLADPARAKPHAFYIKPPDAKPPASGTLVPRIG